MIHLLLRKLAFSQHIAYPISIILFYVLIGIISYIFASFIAWKLVWSLEDQENPPQLLTWLSRRTPFLLAGIIFIILGFMWGTNMLF